MREITLITLISALTLSFISFGVLAASNHLNEAMRHTEAAMASSDGKDLVQHATEAITHARAVYDDKHNEVDVSHMDRGLRFLDSAIDEGSKGKVEAGQEAARQALEHFRQAR